MANEKTLNDTHKLCCGFNKRVGFYNWKMVRRFLKGNQ